MEKRIIILLFLILGSIWVCHAQQASDKFAGFEIYLLKKYHWNKNSFIANKEMSKKFSEFLYPETFNQMPDSICHSYIDPNKVELKAKPLFTTSDIKYYDAKTYTITLTEEGARKYYNFSLKYAQIPFALVAENNTLFTGWFRANKSTDFVDKICIRSGSDFIFQQGHKIRAAELQTELELDFIGCGKDPRNTPHFFAALTEYRE